MIRKNCVRLFRQSCKPPSIHKCYPPTAMCRNCCLLRFRPGPLRSLLSNLVIEISITITILTLCLGRTLVPHKQMTYRQPRTQAVRKPSLQVAGLQVHATTLSCWLLWRTQNLGKSPRDLRITKLLPVPFRNVAHAFQKLRKGKLPK